MSVNPAVPELFANLLYKYLSLRSFKNIEVEARLGHITNIITRRRIDYHVDHPVIFKSLPNELCFTSGVEKSDFAVIKNAVAQGSEMTRRCDQITVARGVRRIECSGEVKYERKTKMATYDIYLPGFRYDVRVSVSKEEPIPQEEKATPKEFISPKGSITRTRDRESYVAGPFSYDFTKVGRESQDAKGYEIELEVKDPENGMTEFVKTLFSLPVIKK